MLLSLKHYLNRLGLSSNKNKHNLFILSIVLNGKDSIESKTMENVWTKVCAVKSVGTTYEIL